MLILLHYFVVKSLFIAFIFSSQIYGFPNKEKFCERACCTSDSSRCTQVCVFKEHIGLIVTKP